MTKPLSLFALSFVALFLELMLIRWVPAVVKIVAYYSNLMLISSFLGLGLGALLSRRGRDLFRWFPLLLLVATGFFLVCRTVVLPASESELRFFAVPPQVLNYLALVGIFLVNAAVFIPLGERIGSLFNRMPPLYAYAWDLGGALAGTVCFGLFSFFAFSPVPGMAAVALVFLVLARREDRIWSTACLASVLAIMAFSTNRDAVWSPYYYITVHDKANPESTATPVDREKLLTMRDPPVYQVRVNQNFYQVHGTIDVARYSPGTAGAREAESLRAQYLLPYLFHPEPQRVVVVGAGGGTDVEGALLANARAVDAVEIDPMLIDLASSYNASGSYDDPRVTVHTDDARSFFLRTAERFDVVVFGFLDSQALSSSMSSIRLDGFVYTVESLRTAWGLVTENGVLSLSFYVSGRPWLVHKLVRMVETATGREPLLYLRKGNMILCVPKSPPERPPDFFGGFQRVDAPQEEVALATDDWPYLYLAQRTVPQDYLLVIGVLLVLSIAGLVFASRGRGAGLEEAHFLFLGMGFLLLETKSIVDCSLYFGATWLVTSLVVAGVLLMVLLANTVAMHLRFTPFFYAGLFVSFLAVYFVSTERILALPFAGRLAWTVLLVPLPIFFAGLIFSTTFRSTPCPASSLGANLVGATIGGFGEYLGMAIGYHRLSLLVIAAYLGSLLCRRRR